MQADRQTSLVQQPDGELTRAVVDEPVLLPETDDGIQFSLGMLGRQIVRDDFSTQDTSQQGSPHSPAGQEASADNPPKRHGLTITTARKNIMTGSASSQTTASKVSTSLPQLTTAAGKDTIPAQQAQRRQKSRKEQLPTVSSVSLDAIPGLRRQASTFDPEQAKQREQGWGLSYKNANAASSVRKEVEVSLPRADDLERVRQLTMEKEALAQQRAQAERAKQDAEAEQREAQAAAKAAARRAAVEAAAARREEESQKRHQFMHETNKMYKAAVEQEEQNTPAFLRMQQQAAAKEAEAEAEKKRAWEEQVASKKFWFTDIKGSLEPTSAANGQSMGTAAEQAKGSSPSPGLSPEASSGHLQAETSQSSVGTASGNEQKKKPKREWQQSLRNSSRFKTADPTRTPWGLSAHPQKLERRLKYHQMQDRGCSPIGSGSFDLDGLQDETGNSTETLLDPLDDSNSLADLAQNLHAVQQSAAAAAATADDDLAAAVAQPSQHGPLMQLLHKITASTSPKSPVNDVSEDTAESADPKLPVNDVAEDSVLESDSTGEGTEGAAVSLSPDELKMSNAEADELRSDDRAAVDSEGVTALQPDSAPEAAASQQTASIEQAGMMLGKKHVDAHEAAHDGVEAQSRLEGIDSSALVVADEGQLHSSDLFEMQTSHQATSTAQPAVA